MAFAIGLDVGTTGLKGILVDPDGVVRTSATSEYRASSPMPGWSEQDPEDWWKATQIVCRQLAKHVPHGELIEAIGLSGQMHGSVFMDQAHRVLRPAILWNDQRTQDECDLIWERTGGKIVDWTLNPPRTAFTATKILWLQRHEPDIFDRVHHVLLPKDYIRFCLTGEFATDVTDASGTNLLDVRERVWSSKTLDALGIPIEWLGRVYESNEVTGHTHRFAADATGLMAGTPVVGGGADQAAAALGNGITRTGAASLTLGTSGVAYVQLDRPQLDASGAFHTFCHSVPGTWQMMAGVLSAGGSFRWYRDVVGQPDVQEAAQSSRDPFDVICQRAATAPIGSEGLVFLPYLTGERSPHADPDARGAWFGLTARHDSSHLARSVVEGINFALRDLVEVLKADGIPVEEVRVAGGGAKSPFWLQILADVLDQPVLKTTSTDASAYGASILAMAHVTGEDVRGLADRWVSTTPGASPHPERVQAYQPYYEVYRQLYPATAQYMHKLSELARTTGRNERVTA